MKKINNFKLSLYKIPKFMFDTIQYLLYLYKYYYRTSVKRRHMKGIISSNHHDQTKGITFYLLKLHWKGCGTQVVYTMRDPLITE